MSGLGTFRRWQGRYAEHRIATFPVRHDKRPLIRNYQRIGLNASGRLAARFADEAAFAFMCGNRAALSSSTSTPTTSKHSETHCKCLAGHQCSGAPEAVISPSRIAGTARRAAFARCQTYPSTF